MSGQYEVWKTIRWWRITVWALTSTRITVLRSEEIRRITHVRVHQKKKHMNRRRHFCVFFIEYNTFHNMIKCFCTSWITMTTEDQRRFVNYNEGLIEEIHQLQIRLLHYRLLERRFVSILYIFWIWSPWYLNLHCLVLWEREKSEEKPLLVPCFYIQPCTSIINRVIERAWEPCRNKIKKHLVNYLLGNKQQ